MNIYIELFTALSPTQSAFGAISSIDV